MSNLEMAKVKVKVQQRPTRAITEGMKGMNEANRFRVWCEYHKDYENHDMVIGKEGQLYRVTRFGELASPGPGHTVEWCVGFKDVHESLVYAGDIVENGCQHLGIVRIGRCDDMTINLGEYSLDYCGVYLDMIGDLGCTDVESRCGFDTWERKGNIHQNGELLDGIN